MRSDNPSVYTKFCSRAILQKSMLTLNGLLTGVAIDGVLMPAEVDGIEAWLTAHQGFGDRHPFNEIIPFLRVAAADGVLDTEERADLVWLCQQLDPEGGFYDATTSGLQKLLGIVGGIAADGVVSEAELRGLREWLEENEGLTSCWPYDEVSSLVTATMADGRIDPEEHQVLLGFFRELSGQTPQDGSAACQELLGRTVGGICAVNQDVRVRGCSFCFTGESSRATRAEMAARVEAQGGRHQKSVSPKLNYLVVGAEGNPCWAYACYGRKIEEAIQLRKAGKRIVIIHERDFWDALA